MTIPNRLPGVVYAQLPVTASRAAALSLPPRLVVIHDTSNNASAGAEAAYAASRSIDGATSAHFYVDGTGPLGSLPLNLQAWAAYSYANSHGWHIEMCGYNAGMTGAVPPRTIAITAGLVRQLCDLAGIPMVKLSPAEVADGARGICGHWDITTGLGVGTHDDPGPRFDWPAFIAAVNGDDMAYTDAQMQAFPWQYDGRGIGDNDGTTVKRSTLSYFSEMLQLVRKIATQVDIDPAELAAIEQAAAQGAREGVQASVDTFVAAVVAKLPPTGLTAEQVEAAVREVFADAGQA